MTHQQDGAAPAAPKKDYLAYTIIGMGGSWARGSDPEDVVRRCAKIAVCDWGHLYKLKGETIPIGLYDVTGHDRLAMDCRGVWAGDVNIPMMEKRDVTLPGKRSKA